MDLVEVLTMSILSRRKKDEAPEDYINRVLVDPIADVLRELDMRKIQPLAASLEDVERAKRFAAEEIHFRRKLGVREARAAGY